MALEAPKIDPRTAADVVAEVETSLEELTPWRRPAGGAIDAGGALARIFARFAELVIARLNRVPDKSFLAFLDLIGARLEPPQPARVPLTFRLVAGSPADALVPAGTRVAAQALEGEAEPPVFETERGLVVTRTRLAALATREPARDLWSDHGAFVDGAAEGAFAPFQGAEPMAHRLYVGHRALLALPGVKTVTVRFPTETFDDPWPEKTAWEAWNGASWQELAMTVTGGEFIDGRLVWRVILEDVPPLPVAGVAEALGESHEAAAVSLTGPASAWLRGRWTEPLPPGAAATAPRIDEVIVAVEVARPEGPPAAGFSDQTALDLTRDFLPFGGEPRVGSAFYLDGDEVFAQPGARVRLAVTLSEIYFNSDGVVLPPNASNTPDPPLRLVWEFWDGADWAVLGESGFGADETRNDTYQFIDGTGGLTAVVAPPRFVQFVCPPTVAAREVNGETRKWLRVRIAQGHYGVGPRYVADGSNGFRLELGDLRPPSVARLRISWTYHSLDIAAQQGYTPEQVFTENDFVLTPRSATEPFTPFVPTSEANPALYLGFARPGESAGFGNRAATLYFGVPGKLYEAAQEDGADDAEAAAEWEYWNGAEWKLLGARDETAAFSRRGLVTFIGPPDLAAAAHLGRVAFWLRARLVRGDAAAARLARVLTNTTWASHAETVADEVLGSGRGEPDQVFHATRVPVLPGQELEVREIEAPTAAELAAIAAEEGADAVAGEPGGGVRVRWHEVPDFHTSGPRSRHYVLDRLTGEARFGDGRHGLVPPAGRGNVRLARYRTGGGTAGNRAAGAVAQLKGSVPYVEGVANPEPAAGGAAAESLAALQLRGPTALRHRDRAVALADFEDLARQASTQVARAHALPAPVADPGTVGLVIVPRGDEPRPVPSLELLGRVRDYVEARLQPTVGLFLAGPDWLRLSVRAEVVPERPEGAADVRAAVLERLTAFLHPLTGGFDGGGWAFGRQPRRSDFYALIEKTPGVDHVRLLTVTEEPDEGGARPDRFLVYSGEHEIALIGSTDEEATP